MKILIIGLLVSLVSFTTLMHAREHIVPTKKIIILLGPPGSGKGTQAKQISNKLGIPHISTGDLFRENLSRKTAIGEKAKAYMDAGKLVPDEIVLDMLKERIARLDCAAGYLLDGFPRTVPQAEELDRILTEDCEIVALNLQVPDEIIVKRIEGRVSCKQCGAIYNRYFSAPKNDQVCDKCGGALVHRSDDNENIVKERLRVYHEQTAPLEDYYAGKGILRTIDGDRDPEVILEEIMHVVQ